MIHPQGRIKGAFPRDQIIIRAGGLLTTSYVLCAANSPLDGLSAGDVDVGHASQVTFWADASWGSTPATSIQIKPVFVPEPRGVANRVIGAHVGNDVYFGDLASTNATTNPATVTSNTLAFASWMVGKKLHIVGGTNWTPGLYEITAFNSATSVTVGAAVGTAASITSGTGGLAIEYQECTIDTSGGTSSVIPHVYSILATDVSAVDAADGGRICWTVPCPAVRVMRVFAKCTGTAALTSLVLGVTLMPEGGL